MKYEKIYLKEGRPEIFLEAFVSDTMKDYRRKAILVLPGGAYGTVCADREGEPVAMDIFKTVGRRLGAGLAILADVIDPEVIVIGSVFARCEDLIRPHMEPIFMRESLVGDQCRIVPAALGEQIGDYAALTVAQMEEWI